jgi:glucosamine--fructose-6-phosphate aminotransferase (isomerizing)
MYIEELARIRTDVEYASEFRYRNPIVTDKTLCVVVSQSGETADTLAAMREAKRRGAKTLGLVNVVGSTIAREDDGGIYLHAGPEIGVASTKAFTSQVIALALLTLKLARLRTMSVVQGREVATAMQALPQQIQTILDRSAEIEEIAERFKDARRISLYLDVATISRWRSSALKLKEISYIHAEGYPAAEMEARPIATHRFEMPVVFVCAARLGVRESRVEHSGSKSARRPSHLHHEPGRAGSRRIDRLRDPRPADDRHTLYPILTVDYRQSSVSQRSAD